MSTRGFTFKEVLLSLFVLLLASVAIFFVARSMQGRRLVDSDIENMRTIYVSLALYEADLQGVMAPDLLAARQWMPDDDVYLSSGDPFASASAPFPVEPGLPSLSVISPVRISHSYIYSFATVGKAKVEPWNELKFDPLTGFLANEWQGEVQPGADFGATVSGTVLRLNTDGALRTLQGSSRQIGDPGVLFFSKE